MAAACSKAPSTGPLVLVDDAGDTVRLPHPALRVASLAPSTTELLFAIGAGSRVVGRTRWCDWPAEAEAVPNLGDGIAPSIEAILGARPDLVVLYQSPSNTAVAGRLRELGIPTIQLRTDSFDDLARNAELLGRALGAVDSARAVMARMNDGLAQLDRRADTLGPRVLLLAWDQPPITIGSGSFQSELVARAGGRNIFSDIAEPSATVSLEAITARQPDVVLTTSPSPAFATRPEWQVVAAVRNRQLVVMPGSEFSRPSPRAPDAIRRLAAAFDSVGAVR
jgi:ABC-type Fe3+-hydroxamate transport system substrate-binding protein